MQLYSPNQSWWHLGHPQNCNSTDDRIQSKRELCVSKAEADSSAIRMFGEHRGLAKARGGGGSQATRHCADVIEGTGEGGFTLQRARAVWEALPRRRDRRDMGLVSQGAGHPPPHAHRTQWRDSRAQPSSLGPKDEAAGLWYPRATAERQLTSDCCRPSANGRRLAINCRRLDANRRCTRAQHGQARS